MKTYENKDNKKTTCTAEIKKEGEEVININLVRGIGIWNNFLEIRTTLKLYIYEYNEFDEIKLKNFKKEEKK